MTDPSRVCRLPITMSTEFSTARSAPQKAPAKNSGARGERARKAPAAAAKAAPATAQVIVLGSSKARGGRYQVLAPMIPTRHASADQLDNAVRLVLASR